MSISLRYTSSKDEAAMIVNDSFMKVFDNLDSFNPKYPFRGWLRRIIINTAIDTFRREHKHFETIEHVSSMEEVPANYEDIISRLTAEDIMSLLNELPEDQRLIFNLVEIEGFSHAETAEKLDIAASTSRSYLSRAKDKLRELFKDKFAEAYERQL